MANKVDMVVRNIRFRHPISSEHLNDQLDEVYSMLVDQLGYQSVSGVFTVSGDLRLLMSDVDDERSDQFGYAASGVADSLIVASGHVGAHCNYLDDVQSLLVTMVANPY